MYEFALLIPCYNNFPGLIRSLESINYSFEAFYVVIVDDGSKVPVTVSDIRAILGEKINLEVLRHYQNAGITKALNTGLNSIYNNRNAKYIARLDCGDLCSPNRFQEQLAFFKVHEEIQLLGTWCIFKKYSTGETYTYTTPLNHKDIVRRMHFKNVFIHPTVMWNCRFNQERIFYPDKFPHAEDYALFYELINKGYKTAILPAFHLTCETNEKGISIANRKLQLKNRLRVIEAYSTNFWLVLFGRIKIQLLLWIPESLLYQLKKILFGTRKAKT